MQWYSKLLCDSLLSSESEGLTTFHGYLQSLPPCLFYIEHILLQRHTATTPMHILTTRGRFLCSGRTFSLVLSAHCLHLMHKHRQGLCPRLLLLLLPTSPSLSSTNQRSISGPHSLKHLKDSLVSMKYCTHLQCNLDK